MSVKEASKLVRRVLAHMLYKPSIQVAAGIFTSRKWLPRDEAWRMNLNWQVGISGGTVERDESPEDALIRELQEELSLRATIVKKQAFGHTHILSYTLKFMGSSLRQRIWTISRCPFIVR